MDKIVIAIRSLWTLFNSLVDIVANIGSFLISILWFLWYGWKTLLVWIRKLLNYIFEWWVFINVNRAFVQISQYIWWPATIFLSALLFLIIVRIIVAFVMKLLRRNVDYHALNDRTEYLNKRERLKL